MSLMAPPTDRPWSLLRPLRRLDAYAPSVRITLALCGVMLACWFLQESAATIPLLLGVIASALAETDDNWRGRFSAQVTTLVCFALVIAAVQSSLARPAMLMGVFVASSFLLTLLGALGDRYRTMATATLIMSIYAALATAPGASRALAHQQQLLLMGGAAWHGAISVGWAFAFPLLPVEQKLAQLYAALGRTLELKSGLLEPVRGVDRAERRLALALHNGRVVEALNAAKNSLQNHINTRQVPLWLGAALHRFFVAQDVHERANSSHEDYELLAETFFHSDVLYRGQRALALLGDDCVKLAQATARREPLARDGASAHAIDDLAAAIGYVETVASPLGAGAPQRARRALRLLADNVAAIGDELRTVFAGERRRMPVDTALQDVEPRTPGQFRDRLRAQFKPDSPLLRHAIRLSWALLAGCTLMLGSGDRYGFWILLTIVFVCQPYYGATLTRLAERIGGTLVGLLVGWALLKLFPEPMAQAAFIVVAAVYFFTLRTTRYLLATAGITVFVMLSLNQVGDGYDLIVPRLLDTLAGSLIAAVAVWKVLPSWHSPRLPRLAADALRGESRYLKEIMVQYATAGRDDNLAYRIARRDAHQADALLASALTAALGEPRRVRGKVDAGTRFLLLSHTQLNYLSALGAHRDARLQSDEPAVAAATLLQNALESLAQMLDPGAPGAADQALVENAAKEAALLRALTAAPIDEAESHRVVRAQLALALGVLPALRGAAATLAKK